MDTELEIERPLSDSVAEEIRVAMARRQVKQSELARRLGANDQWLSVRLRGMQEIGVNDLQRIARALNVPVRSLIPTSDDSEVKMRTGAYGIVDRPAGRPVADKRPPNKAPGRRQNLIRRPMSARPYAA